MNFKQYEAFYWIGRLGSFRAAARHLRTAQPTISARIRELEEVVGVDLFDRAARNARLTPKGHELMAYAAQLIALANDVQQRVGTRESLTGRVGFGATNTHAMTWLPELARRVARTHPGLVLEFAIDTSESLRALIERGHLDLGVLAGPFDSRKLAAEPVGRVSNVWIASPALNTLPRPCDARDLANLPLISDGPGTLLHAATMEWFRAEGVEPRLNHGCSQLTTRVHLALEGVGVALAARSTVAPHVARGALEIVHTKREAPALAYFLAHLTKGLSPGARVVAQAAKQLLEQKPDLDAYYAASINER
jgi:DNA-binding transcriptional LysR family regulator